MKQSTFYDDPLQAQTLPEALARLTRGPGPDMVVLDERGGETTRPVEALTTGAYRGAAALQLLGVHHGDRVLVALRSGPLLLEAMQAIALTGAAQIPFYPPAPNTPMPAYVGGLTAVLAQARPQVIWCEPIHREVFEAAAQQAGLQATILTDVSTADPTRFEPVEVGPDDLAMIQFTSGSTANPKGVLLTHGSLMANVRAVREAARFGSDETFVMWVPLQNNLGFMFSWMALLIGARLVWLPAIAVLADPKRWLWTIHQYRATFSVASNYIYQLLVNTVTPEDAAGLDLSCWRSAGTGGEPVLWSTVEAFTTKFAPYGFQPGILRGGYGMTELTFGVAYSTLDRPLRVDWVDAETLETAGRAVPMLPETAGPGRRLAAYVSMGPPMPGIEVRVVEPCGKILGERMVGELQVLSPSRMVGYLNDPLSTEEAFAGDWLRTGDLGYMIEGEVVVVGRRKELIVKGGRKIVPQDLERIAERVPGVRPGGVAAFGVPSAQSGTEVAVMVVESAAPDEAHEELVRAVTKAVWEGAGLSLDHVTVVPPGAVPRTASNKVQRARARMLWIGNKITFPTTGTVGSDG